MFVSHLTAIRTLLSQCAAFQAWVSAMDATEALDSIILGRQAPPELTRFAVVGPAGPTTWQSNTIGGPGIAAGAMARSARLTFVRYLEDGEDESDLGYTLAAAFLGVVEDCTLQILAQRGGTSAPEDSFFTGWEGSDEHLLPEDEDNPGITPAYVRNGEQLGYMHSIDFTWET